MKEIKTVDAVGHVLCHDITQIIKDVSKGPVFRKGHVIREEDIPVLLSVGKDHIYVWENDETMMHENDAAEVLCEICKGENISRGEVKEGKIELRAECDGLFKIDEEKLNCVKNGKPVSLMYILTGSNTHEIRQKASETLAGRTAIIEVGSLTECEKRQIEGEAFVPNIEIIKSKKTKLLAKNRYEVFEEIFKGGMPEYWINNIDRTAFFESYITTYLEKDVSKMINVDKLDDFRRFMTITALRTGQQVDYTDIGRAVGIDSRTAKGWISILEASGITMLLQPYANNLAKRIIKTPKLYFLDTGLCAYLCGWSDPRILEASPMAGAFFETYVVSEIVKSLRNDGKRVEYTLYYYRDRDQKEVDILYIKDQTIYPIEIKKGIGKDNANKNFNILDQYKMPVATGLIIDTGESILPLNRNAYYCPVGMIGL